MLRRHFLFAAAPAVLRGASLTHKERMDRALAGRDVDRPPFSHWHHFGLKTPDAHAQRTLEYHRAYRTDLVKVMSDFPYPKGSGSNWYDLKPVANPFPEQIRALELIRDGLGGESYFVETVFHPWNVAEKLSSPQELQRLKRERPQALLDALDVITESEVAHVKRSLQTGAAGIFLSVANAKPDVLSREEYLKFSAPFDRRVLEAANGARVNILHLHVAPGHLDLFRDFPPAVINYSLHVSGIPMADMRKQYPALPLMGGIDEVNYRRMAAGELKAQWQAARAAAGPKFLLSPGCSVPDQSTDAELRKLPELLKA